MSVISLWGCLCFSLRFNSKTDIEEKIKEEIAFMKQAMKKDPDLDKLLKELANSEDLTKMLIRFYKGQLESAEEWKQQQSSIQKLQGLGTTQSLKILPLVEWYASREDHQSLHARHLSSRFRG
jgi:hypothetical protein